MKRNSATVKSIILCILSVLCVAVIFGMCLVLRDVSYKKAQAEMLSELDENEGNYDSGSIVLSKTNRSKAEKLAERLGASLRITKDGSFATLTLPEGVTIGDICADSKNADIIKDIAPDYKAYTADYSEEDEDEVYERLAIPSEYTPSDTLYPMQSYLNYINMGKLWNKYKGGGTCVAVIDTGIDTDHPEFAGRISEYSYNASEDKTVSDYVLENGSYDWSLIEDEQGHGTAVAGVIGASMNGDGISGIAPEVTLLVIKAECDENGAFERSSDLVFALYYAIERNADVVNMSFGGKEDIYKKPLQLAYDSDIICVASGGNNYSAELTYPAAYNNVIGVGALEDGGWELADYSNFGENINLVAPGTVYTCGLNGTYKTMDGTSFSSPIVAAVIALMKSDGEYSNADNNTITEILYASCFDLGDTGCDFYYGYGALDVSALMFEERGSVTFNYLTDEIEETEQVFIRNHTLQNIPEPERLYSVFDGWYYDIECTEKLNLYEDVFVSDIVLYARWVNESDGIPYTYVTLDDGTVEIRSYTGRRRYITIPDIIDGKTVSSIGSFAFNGETRLRSVTLPSGLKGIREYAFCNCVNLISVKIPDGVTDIGEYAFCNNVRLSSVSLGKKSRLSVIGEFAFSCCSSLRTFYVPSGINELDGSAFFGDSSMQSFSVEDGNASYASQEGVLFDISMGELVAYPAGRKGEYRLPSGVTKIGDYAFGYTRLSSVGLDGVSELGDKAFCCSSLKSVNIPDSVTFMGACAFEKSEYLRAAYIGSGLTKISSGAFTGTGLTEILIPSGITRIESNAFAAATSLRSVLFAEGSSLFVIEYRAFCGTGISSIALPDSCMYIGDEAFMDSYLSDVNIGEKSALAEIGNKAFSNNIYLKSFTFPSGLKKIGDYAFSVNKGYYTFMPDIGLTGNIVIPASVSYIGAGAFASCRNVENIYVEESSNDYCDEYGVVYSKDMTRLIAYPSGNKRTRYEVNAGTVEISGAAFYDSFYLEYVSLPESLTYIDEYAFAENTSVGEISIPDNVVQIGRYAFFNDYNLHHITFSENSKLPRISYASFAYTGIYDFTVPANVSSISQYAFAGCSEMSKVTFSQNSKLQSVSAFMFKGAENIKSIVFMPGSALKSVQAHGFEGMSKLEKIDFGDAKVGEIDNFAFRFCESLREFSIPDGVTSIGRYAFYFCVSLNTVNIPDTTEHIGSYAFLGTNTDVYFASETPPASLDENWDGGVRGYHFGVINIVDDTDFKYAVLTGGNIAILAYYGDDIELDLNTVDFGGCIVTIGGGAFEYAKTEKIILPSTLVTIQAKAFYHSCLTGADIPGSTVFIGREAFADTPIEKLVFAPDSRLRTIERSAFENTPELGSVIIPASVTTLGRSVFYSSGISSLAFAEGTLIKEIPNEAFAYTGITSVRLPESVEVIGYNAFEGSEKLAEVVFGTTNETVIYGNAFYNTGLAEIYIPENVVYIGEYSFVGLKALTEFTVSENNKNYKAVDGFLYSKDERKLIASPAGIKGTITVPASTEVIGFGAFENSSASEIVFNAESNILSLGYRAFYNARYIKSITIPKSVVTVDYYAFAECVSLEKVIFESGSKLNGIYEGAFCGCRRLSDIALPDSIIEISDFAFYGCSEITDIPVSEASGLRGIYDYAMAYTGISGELTTPGTLYDIGNYAFMGNRITGVVIPDDNAEILVIGIGAFEDCNKLEYMEMPFIGASFEGPISWFGYIFGAGTYESNPIFVPESLKRVTISGDISFVGYGAFYNLANIEAIDIPDSVTTLYRYSFEGTTAKYQLKNSIATADELGGTDLFFGCFGKGLTGHLDIANGVTCIGGIALRGCCGLTGVSLPDSVTCIEWQAFSGCGITCITIPRNVTSIGGSAFWNFDTTESCIYKIYNNSDLVLEFGSKDNGAIAFNAKIIVDKNNNISYRDPNVEYIETTDGFLFENENGEYRLCAYFGNEETVTLPDSINGNPYKIYRMRGIRNVIVPENKNIDDYSFYRCVSLGKITIQDGTYLIGEQSFLQCFSLKEIVLPESVMKIGSLAFCDCRGLTHVTINNPETDITSMAFSGCHIKDFNLKDAYVIDGVVYDRYIRTAIICIDAGVKNVRIPDSVIEIGGVFNGCTSLESVVIPSGIREIRFNTFRDCTSLRSVSIPEGVWSIGQSAFYGCVSLESVNLPGSITDIDDNAFYGCTELKEIVIPDSVKDIGNNAFSGCSALRKVTLPKGLTAVNPGVFNGCQSLTNIDIPEGVISIDTFAFRNCSALYSITLPGSLASIGDKAFEFCTGLSEISIPVENRHFVIQDGILYNNPVTRIIFVPAALQGTVTIPDGITEIEGGAFEGQQNLSRITIPDSVISIGDFAFHGCKALIDITLGKGVKSIGNLCFADCDIRIIHNGSDLELTFGDDGNGFIAQDAYRIYDKNGNATDRYTDITYIETPDKLLFEKKEGAYTLFAYFGKEDTVTLPDNIEGELYGIKSMSGGKTVYIPDSVLKIEYQAFGGNYLERIIVDDNNPNYSSQDGILYNKDKTDIISIPKSIRGNITLPDGIESIGDIRAGINYYYSRPSFLNCRYLTGITVPSSVKIIGERAFYGCESLMNIELPDGLEYIGGAAFKGTEYYNNPVNWNDGSLYIGNYLIKLSAATVYLKLGENISNISNDAYKGCRMLKNAYVFGNNWEVLSDLSNLETLIIGKLPQHGIKFYFLYGEVIPITFKNVVIKKSAVMNENIRFDFACTIYVEQDKEDTRWDDNFPGWNYGNNVIYKGKWINVDFYYDNGNIKSLNIYKIHEVIRVLWTDDKPVDDVFTDIFTGYDTSGDGVPDMIPATSKRSISAKEVFTKVYNCELTGHIYDSACDDSCNICGKTREAPHSYNAEWSADSLNHWHECALCKGKTDISAHIYGDGKDECDICGRAKYLAGDLDGNEKINEDDAIYLLYYTFFPEDYPINQSCDFDSNGRTDEDDAIYLLYYTFFPEDYPIK